MNNFNNLETSLNKLVEGFTEAEIDLDKQTYTALSTPLNDAIKALTAAREESEQGQLLLRLTALMKYPWCKLDARVIGYYEERAGKIKELESISPFDNRVFEAVVAGLPQETVRRRDAPPGTAVNRAEAIRFDPLVHNLNYDDELQDLTRIDIRQDVR